MPKEVKNIAIKGVGIHIICFSFDVLLIFTFDNDADIFPT